MRLQWIPRHLFLSRNDAADEQARRGALRVPSAIPCSLSLIHSFLFSDWRRTVSSKFFDTQAPSISTEELVLPCHARCVLSRLRCNGHSLLLSSYQGLAELRILHAAPADTRQRAPLISFCTVQVRLFVPLALWQLSVSLRPLIQALWSFPASGAPWFSVMFPSLGRGRETTITTLHVDA